MKQEGRVEITIPQPMEIMKTLNSKQIEIYYEYVCFEDISTEDTIYEDEKNNGQYPIVLVVCYKLNRNKENQRIEFRKEVKKTKISTTTYKKKKQFKNSLLNNKKRLLICNLLFFLFVIFLLIQ